MKKYVFGFFVIMMAISLSAFTIINGGNKNFTDYYWFKVAAGQGSDNTLNNSQVTDYLGLGSTAPTGGCADNGSKNCVVGFSAGQVVEIDQMNHIYELNSGDQTVQLVGHTRSTE